MRKEVKNYKNSTQKLKKLSSPQPWRAETQKSYRLSLNTSLQNSDENSFVIRGKSMHTMQGLGLDLENSKHGQIKAQLEKETQQRKKEWRLI